MMSQSRRHIDHSPAAAVAAANQSTGIRGNAVFVPPAAQQADTEVPILDGILQVRHLDQIPATTTSTLPLSEHQVAIAAPTVAGLANADHAVPVAFVTVVREDITGTGLALMTGTPAGYGRVYVQGFPVIQTVAVAPARRLLSASGRRCSKSCQGESAVDRPL